MEMRNIHLPAALPLLITLAAFCLISCATQNGNGYVSAGGEDVYERLGLSTQRVEPWEDGMRTDGGRGTYEWWYFDTKMEDGSALVIVFYTKIMLEVQKSLSPVITVTMTNPDGTTALERVFTAGPEAFSAATDSCDVRIGKNTFTGNLRDYALHLDFDDLKADIALHGTTPAWRPGTGHSFFTDKRGTSYFAWLPAVPRGEVTGTLTIHGETRDIIGSGYHDHNWGDASIVSQMHDWYWGRAEVGPYTVITSWITADDRYGGQASPVFFLSRDGELLAEDGAFVTCTMKDVYMDDHTGKPVAGVLTYDYDDGSKHYRVTFTRERDIANVVFIDQAGGLSRIIGKIIRFDGAYLRFTGRVTIERFEETRVVETAVEDAAVWELMYLGYAPAQDR